MKAIVIIPTYNEKRNITRLVEIILNLNINIQILIIDDNSPDGTGQIAEKLSSEYHEINVIHRKGKLGLGTAYLEGFKYALKNKFDYIFEMDADFSHNPKYLPVFLEAIKKYDLVLGSRYINGISVINWGFGRLLLSKLATFYVRIITRLPVTDATGGFKCFRQELLKSIDLDKVYSNGYSFQIEMTYKAYIKNFKIGEVPIVFKDRLEGKSKMNKKIVIEALGVVWRLQFEHLIVKLGEGIKKAITNIINSRFSKFCLVGGVGFIINIGIFYITHSLVNIQYIFCSIISFFFAVSSNFILNKYWTFKDYGRKKILLQYLKYILVNIGGLTVNIIVLTSFISFFGQSPLFSQVVGVLMGIGINFIGSKIWVFDFIKTIKNT